MNIEKLPNITERIAVEDTKERETILYDKLFQVSLLYAEKVFLENKESKLSDTLKKCTPVENIILKDIHRLENFNYKKHEESINGVLESFYSEVDKVDVSNYQEIIDLVNKKKSEISEFIRENGFKTVEPEERNYKTELLKYNDINDISHDQNSRYEILLENGFNKYNELLEIHFPIYGLMDRKNLGSNIIKSDFERIAKYIVDEKPKTSAVVGRSWILDSALAQSFGFNIIESKEEANAGDYSTWQQFIDKDGQINHLRLEKFIKEGKLPYNCVVGYIPVEDFLKKYYPKNDRKQVAIKEIDQEKTAKWDVLKEKFSDIKKDWDECIEKKHTFTQFINGNKNVDEVMTMLSDEGRAIYQEFLETMFNKNVKWDDFRKFNEKNTIDIVKKEFDNLFTEDVYHDRIIDINN